MYRFYRILTVQQHFVTCHLAGLDGEISYACFPEEQKLYIANIVNQELVKDSNLFKTDGSEDSRNSLWVKGRCN